MGFRFRRSIRIFPGLRINLGKRGASLSVGGHGATVNLSARGTRTTVGLPGTGLSYSTYAPRTSKPAEVLTDTTGDSAGAGESEHGAIASFFGLIGAFVRLVWAVFVLLLRIAFLLFLFALAIAAVWQIYRAGTSAHQ